MDDIIKIKEIGVSKLTTAEYTGFMTTTNEHLTTAGYEKLGIPPEAEVELLGYVAQLLDVNKQSTVSHESAEMIAVDTDREDTFTYAMSVLRTAQKSPIEAIRAAAKAVYEKLKPYEGIQKAPNKQQTELFEGLWVDAKKEPTATNLKTIHLYEVLKHLNELNNQYRTLTNNRATAQVANTLESSKEIRKKCDALYDRIITRAFVASVATPTPETAAFVTAMNKLIADTNASFKQRIAQTRGKKRPSTTPETPAQTTPETPANEGTNANTENQ